MTATFNFTGGSQTFVVSVGGYYFLRAFGAAGGSSSGGSGGAGAGASGYFTLSAGEVLTIIVGGTGGTEVSGSGGGGGGTFVIETNTGSAAVDMPLLIAGGGGGSGYGSFSSGAGGASYAITGGLGGSGAGSVGGGGGGGYSGGAGGGAGLAGGAGTGPGFGYAGGAANYGGAGGYGGGGGGGFHGGGGGGGGYGGGDGGNGSSDGGGGGGSLDKGNGLLAAATNSGPGSVSITAVCFLRGTHILTPTGPVRVEDLRIGDTVVTRFGGIQPIRWIGRQNHAAEAARHDPRLVPVRIAAGAIADRVPARDLFISPGHSMLLRGVLVLGGLMVNGVTVTQDWCPPRIEYFHLELASHDCVIADGAWAETFADAQQMRDAFDNAADFDRLYPDAGPAPDEFTLCAPRPQRGPALAAALQEVADRVGLAENATVVTAKHSRSVLMYCNTNVAARR